jgi:uncharacterized protein
MILALFITLVGASVLSCLLTPIVFDLLNMIYGSAPWPFSRVFDRVFLALLLAFIISFRKKFDLGCLKEALRIPLPRMKRALLLALGFIISSLTVGLCTLGVFNNGTLSINPRSTGDIIYQVLLVIPGAIIIAIIEELFFRVLLLARLRDYFSLYLSIFITALFYATVHFITPQKSFVYHGNSWLEGFGYVPALLERLIVPGTGLGIAGLFVVGLLLSYAMIKIGSVYLAIGLHAGWICSLKLISYISLRNPEIVIPEGLGGRYILFSQGWTWLSFAIVFFILYLLSKKLRFQRD